MPERWILTILCVILAVLSVAFPLSGARVQSLLHITTSNDSQMQANDLAVQNQILKAKVAQSDALRLESFPNSGNDIFSPVFSRYPFNLKNQLLIARGSLEGVVVGQSALAGVSGRASGTTMGVLIGRIDKTSKHASVVTTVFDAQWRSSVRIGNAGTQGLLIGGSDPRITLIAKDASLKTGDIIYNVDPRFPYGAPIGEVRTPSFTSDKTSQETNIKFLYDVGTLEDVFVTRNYDTSTP